MKRIIFVFGILFFYSSHSMSLFSSAPTKPAPAIPAPAATAIVKASGTEQITNNKTITEVPEQSKAASAPQAQIINQTSPVIVNVTNNVSQNENSVHNMNNSANQAQTAAQQANQTTHQEVFQATITTVKTTIKEGAHQAREQMLALGEWIKSNKYKLMLASACCCYAATFAYLVRAQMHMNDEDLWARWRTEDSYEQLMSIPHKQLSQDLIFAIQRRYTTGSQFTDFIQPLVSFMRDIEAEKKLLKNYIETGKWIMRLRVSSILPINEKKISHAKKLLQRLQFFEHVFLSWAAEFKIQQNMITS